MIRVPLRVGLILSSKILLDFLVLYYTAPYFLNTQNIKLIHKIGLKKKPKPIQATFHYEI